MRTHTHLLVALCFYSVITVFQHTCKSYCVCPGAFNYLKENFSNAPSLDMSGPSLCMLVRLMIAQVQECVFERVTLTTPDTHFITQLQVAKEAARVRGRVCLCVKHVIPTGAQYLEPVSLLKTSLLFWLRTMFHSPDFLS